MNRILSVIMAVSVILTGISFPAGAAETDAGEETGIENYSETDSLDEFQEEVLSLNEENPLDSDGRYATKRLIVLSETSDFDNHDAESVIAFDGMYVLSYASEQECANAYKNLSADNSIDMVEVDEVMEVGSLGDSEESIEELHKVETSLKRHLNEMNAEKDVTVAVLDTGIDEGLIELDEVVDTKINLSDSGEADSILDDNGHGTEMASIILLNGNEKTKVMPIKIANQDGSATVLNTYLGIRQAIENNADTVNISIRSSISLNPLLLLTKYNKML